jgi:uncharacterized protein YjbI with pentapeptide repeats
MICKQILMVRRKKMILKKTLNVLPGLLVILLASLLSCDFSEVPAKDIIKKINNGEDVYYKNATIKGHLDFATVKDNFVNGSVTFIGCTFKGDVTAKGTVFKKDVKFTDSIIVETHPPFFGKESAGIVDFSGAQFMDSANFEGVQFPRHYIHFEKVQFMGNVCFDGAQFQDFAWFSRAQFTGAATYVGARFIYAGFRATFLGGASFKDAQFRSTADFYDAQFTNYANFEGTTFFGAVVFDKATLNGELFKPLIMKKTRKIKK